MILVDNSLGGDPRIYRNRKGTFWRIAAKRQGRTATAFTIALLPAMFFAASSADSMEGDLSPLLMFGFCLFGLTLMIRSMIPDVAITIDNKRIKGPHGSVKLSEITAEGLGVIALPMEIRQPNGKVKQAGSRIVLTWGFQHSMVQKIVDLPLDHDLELARKVRAAILLVLHGGDENRIYAQAPGIHAVGS
ncbi:hypothetical protein [Stratiformator vulcanicus]|uniref:Uncharacterized protein n=1 Tax=Stratiformator vulcanicus TaxID=2527980 RepID=A0A517R1G0_9PLAN|nr:hypothetical protein [Stratiformator vulcanicus]QDT37692.1 hypothetical protein Pan189_20740 [Stratiformator vulcanicus]